MGTPRSATAGFLSPFELAKAWRDEQPGKFDDLDDAELVRAIETEDPDSYALIDPLLIGAETLTPIRKAPGATPPRLIPPPPTASTFDTVATTGLRVVPAIAGGIGGSYLAPGYGTYAGGAAGAGLGEVAAQTYEKAFGPREAYDPGVIGLETLLGAVNPGARGATVGRRIAGQAGVGAGLGLAGQTGRTAIEEGRLPTGQEAITATLLGSAFGGATHGAFEGVGALGRRAPSFGDATGALDGGPPQLRSPMDDLVVARAAAFQYEQEEARLATELNEKFGAEAMSGYRQTDLHTATQARDYLQQIAELRAQVLPIPPMDPTAWGPGIPEYLNRPLGLDAPPRLLPERAGPNSSPDFVAYPPEGPLDQPFAEAGIPGFGTPPILDEVGRGGRARIIANEPPASPLEEALTASLQQPPGPARLRTGKPHQALTLAQPGGSGIPELGQPGLVRRPTTGTEGRIRSPQFAELGGAPPSLDQPRLPGVTHPRPIDRTYAEGPNAGPRREGEAHGQPRTLRRQLEVGGKTTYEQYPSTLAAEDPGTYPPEVRRELARIAWELDAMRYERHQGGYKPTMGTVEEAKRSGATSGGATAGAPVYHDIIAAAEGGFAHATREDVLRMIREALLQGKGNALTDAAAQIARRRLAGELETIGATGAGDDLIGWEDALGHRALPGQDIDEWHTTAREAEDGEILAATKIWVDAGGAEGINPDTVPFFEAAREEAVRRGLLTPEQLELKMEGPGGAGGPSLFDFEGEGMPPRQPSTRKSLEEEGPPPENRISSKFKAAEELNAKLPPLPDRGPGGGPFVPAREPQRIPPEFLPVLPDRGDVPLPGAEFVRGEERVMPRLGEVEPSPIPPGKPEPGGVQPGLFDQQQTMWQRFMTERGVLILDVPAGDRTGLRRWLKKQEDEHGGARWFSRVEHYIEEGDWDKAWKAAASASAHSYTKAYAAATTPREEEMLRRAVKGTALQADLPAQIIAVGRSGQQKRPAPTVEGFPPSYQATVRQGGQGMTLGPAGIINPGPPTMKPPIKSRSATLDKEIMDTFVEELADHTDLLHLVRNNRDASLRLGRQVTDLVVQGQVKFDPADFPGMTREEVGRQYMHTLSEAGRILGSHGRYVQEFSDELHEMADRMDMGAALAGTLGRAGRPPVLGARGRESSKAAADALDRAAQATATPQVTTNLLRNDLQKPRKRSTGDLLMDSQYSFLTAGFATAMRNAYTGAARYGWDLLDQALARPIAAITGEEASGRLAGALLRERVGSPHTSFAVTPYRAAWADNFEDLYRITGTALEDMKPSDSRRTLKILSEYPDEAAHLIGFAGGEELASEGSNSTILNALLNPKLQRYLTLWNRSQEFTGRALTFDTHFRAQLRTRGLDPTTVLQDPSSTAVAKAVGGDRALQDMLRYASNAALEMTWAGQLANRSIPGALVKAVQDYWPAKLVQRFPRFNFSAAPRWIYDHSPAALLDLVRLPFDAAGWSSTGKAMGGGRLYRGLKAQTYQTDVIPALRGEITQAEGELGGSVLELQSTGREWAIRQRQVKRLEGRAQASLPDTQTALTAATMARDQLAQRRDRLKGQISQHKTTVQDLQAQEGRLWKEVQNATGISAPTWSSWMARMTSGTFGLLGAAIVVRSQEAAQGTRFYQYRIDDEEGGDPYMLDLRAAAPFVQYLMVADVLVDLYRYTNWDKAKAQAQDTAAVMPPGLVGSPVGGAAAPLAWTNAVWDNYEGKYTKQLLGAEFAQAFLSISRAAGTTLTIADLMTRNGWPGPNEAVDAMIGTIGQFLAGYATPLGQVKDVVGQFSEEERQIRATPRPSASDPASWSYPLAEGLGRVPGASRLLPPTYSQTTGEPVRSVNPGVRAITGIGGTQVDFIQEEATRIGLPGSTRYFRETGDKGLDDLLHQIYARVQQSELPGVFESPDYQQLGTPAAQRDYLQKVFPLLKRAALAETKDLLGSERVSTATVVGEEARRQKRRLALIERLEAAEPPAPQEPPDTPEPVPTPPVGPPPFQPFQ